MTEPVGQRLPAQRRWQAIGRVLEAHTIMLRDVGLIDDDALAVMLRAIEAVGDAPAPDAPLVRAVETFDDRVDALAPAGMSGVARVGRGTPEVIATVIRLGVREGLLDLADALVALRETLIAFAQQHALTLMPVYLDAQLAQPSTLAHLLGAIVGPLDRANRRLIAAIAVVDRSPMGGGALASSGMPIDRARAAELLGFGGVAANTLDSVAATDQLTEAAEAVAAVAVPIRRLGDLFLTWIRQEPTSFRLPDEVSAFPPELPQARVPVGMTELVASARRAEALAMAVRAQADALPLAPIYAGIDDVLADVDACLAAGDTAVQGAATLLSSVEVNRALLANRAGKGFSTSGDLADFLMLEEQIDPGAARNIAALTISRTREQGLEASGITPELIDGAALLVIGREIKAEFEAISRYLAPRRFIERRTAEGAPSPASTRAWLERAAEQVRADREQYQSVLRRISQAAADIARIRAEARDAANG